MHIHVDRTRNERGDAAGSHRKHADLDEPGTVRRMPVKPGDSQQHDKEERSEDEERNLFPVAGRLGC